MNFKVLLESKLKRQTNYEFNVLIVGEIFKSTSIHLLVGTVDGKIIVYLNNREIEVLETKGGSIQHLELLDTTKFGSKDIISGDSNGNIVIFSNHQILYRESINGSITSIITHHLAIRDMKSVKGKDVFGNGFHYIVLSENSSFVHIMDHGQRLYSIPTPSPVNCMCIGYFNKNLKSIQVALGCNNGIIYLLHDFKIEPYCEIGYPITKLSKLKYQKNNKMVSQQLQQQQQTNIIQQSDQQEELDFLICAGHFHSLKIYYDRVLICNHILDDWVHTMSIGDVENNGETMIVVGKLDNTIEYLQVKIMDDQQQPSSS
eukprot:gene5736-7134_t